MFKFERLLVSYGFYTSARLRSSLQLLVKQLKGESGYLIAADADEINAWMLRAEEELRTSAGLEQHWPDAGCENAAGKWKICVRYAVNAEGVVQKIKLFTCTEKQAATEWQHRQQTHAHVTWKQLANVVRCFS
jgi:hypothetical protein